MQTKDVRCRKGQSQSWQYVDKLWCVFKMILKADIHLSENYHHNMTDMCDNGVIQNKTKVC